MCACNTRCVFALSRKDESVCAISVIVTIQRGHFALLITLYRQLTRKKKQKEAYFDGYLKFSYYFIFFIYSISPNDVLRNSRVFRGVVIGKY